MTPEKASKKRNESTVYFNLYGNMEQLSSKPKFKVGDKVRISKYKRIFFTKAIHLIGLKRYSWSIKSNHLQVRGSQQRVNTGSFYEPELLKATQDIFRIDKFIWRDYKKKQALVKWLGYSDDFNSWIPLSSLQDLSN